MKEFLCRYCQENWFVNDEKEEKIEFCPFCSKKIFKPKKIEVVSVSTAILKIITDYGIETLNDSRKFFAYFSDVAFEYQKEKRILAKTCDDKILSRFFDLSKLPYTDAKNELKKIEFYLSDEEGISEIWSKKICDYFFQALFHEHKLSMDNIRDDSNQTVLNDHIGVHDETSFNEENCERYNSILFDIPEMTRKELKGEFSRITRFAKIDETAIKQLGSLSLPNNVEMIYVDARIIPQNALVNCAGAKVVFFSSKVIDIDNEAFAGCNNLKYVVFINENRERIIRDKGLISNLKKIYCSVKDHNLRGRYTWCKCYDFGALSDEKSSINSLISMTKEI